MFFSILFPDEEQNKRPRVKKEPDCFKDLNLAQIISPLLKNRAEYQLEEFFYTPLQSMETVIFRQKVMRESDEKNLYSVFSEFSKLVFHIGKEMVKIREVLKIDDREDENYLIKGRLIDFADRYCKAVMTLSAELCKFCFDSRGLENLSGYLKEYCRSERFEKFYCCLRQLKEELSKVEYCMLIGRGAIRVRKYEGQEDYSEKILETFEKFRKENDKQYIGNLPEAPAAEHVEEAVLKMVAKLYRGIFTDVNEFCAGYSDFEDDGILRFAREIQFYLAWMDLIRPLQGGRIHFNYPEICETADRLYVQDGFDIVLATKIHQNIVVNSFELNGPEHIIVVTGPNQGGKTTFARAFGQIHYLASLGLSVPGRKAALFLSDHIYTHFGREENPGSCRGKLQDDLLRLRDILSAATGKSIIIVNEIFSSTTLQDALLLGKHMMDKLIALSVPAVVVTFLDELASYGPETVSMVSMVDEENGNERTYRIVRKPPDGLAYAERLARKYRVTYDQLSRRLKNECTSDVSE